MICRYSFWKRHPGSDARKESMCKTQSSFLFNRQRHRSGSSRYRKFALSYNSCRPILSRKSAPSYHSFGPISVRSALVSTSLIGEATLVASTRWSFRACSPGKERSNHWAHRPKETRPPGSSSGLPHTPASSLISFIRICSWGPSPTPLPRGPLIASASVCSCWRTTAPPTSRRAARAGSYDEVCHRMDPERSGRAGDAAVVDEGHRADAPLQERPGDSVLEGTHAEEEARTSRRRTRLRRRCPRRTYRRGRRWSWWPPPPCNSVAP